MQAPKYILDLDAQRVLWDHRLHTNKAAASLLKSIRPHAGHAGRVWCVC
jgi:hypothetical protein